MTRLLRRLGALSVPLVATVAVAAAPASASTTNVPATASAGVSTGIYVTAGDTVSVTASGTGYYGYEGEAGCTGYPATAPNGDRTIVVNGTTVDCGVKDDPNALLSGYPIGLLVARVGAGAWTSVSTSRTWVAATTGYLYLAYNDSLYSDNSGSYSAAVTITPGDGGSGGGGGGGGGCFTSPCPL